MVLMALLQRIEQTLGSLLEGGFGRVFRSPVKPMEIARRLAREMDAHRTTSLSRTYAPNEFLVWLSPADREQFAGVEEDLIAELCAYLLEHARREELTLLSRPMVGFQTDPRLRLGEFAIQARLIRPQEERQAVRVSRQTVQPQPPAAPQGASPAAQSSQPPQVQQPAGQAPSPAVEQPAAPQPAAAGQQQPAAAAPAQPNAAQPPPVTVPPPPTVQPAAQEGLQEPGAAQPLQPAVPLTPQPPPAAAQGPRAALVVAGRRIEIGPEPVVVGRSRACDIVIDDPGVSRRHAEIRPSGEGFEIRDLGSTNGVYLNRAPIDRAAPLRHGDVLELGATEIRFEQT